MSCSGRRCAARLVSCRKQPRLRVEQYIGRFAKFSSRFDWSILSPGLADFESLAYLLGERSYCNHAGRSVGHSHPLIPLGSLRGLFGFRTSVVIGGLLSPDESSNVSQLWPIRKVPAASI